MESISDDFFSSVIDAAPDAMLIVDGEGVITLANRQANDLFGTSREALVGSSVDELLPAEVRSRHRAHRLRFKAEPSVRPMGVDLLLQAQRVDGRQFPVEVSLSPLNDGSQSVVVAVRDVSARVATEDQMRRVLRTLDAMDDAVFIMDSTTFRFTYVNEGAARQLGYSRDELVGMSPMHVNPVTSEQSLRDRVEQLSQDGPSTINLFSTHRRRDGTDLPVEVTLQSAPDTQDGAASVIVVARDITERMRSEEELRRSQAALREAEQVMAVADDRERIARDLHDIVIQRIFASGLALQALSQRAEPAIAARLERVVDDLDDTISEIRTSIFALQAASTESPGVRTRVLDVVREGADALGFEPRIQFDGPIESIDHQVADHLFAVVRETLTNVARHAHASAVLLRLEVVESTLTLTVTDDGIGGSGEPHSGNGLPNLTWRAESLGGALTIGDADPGGTTVVWRVPAHGEPAARPVA